MNIFILVLILVHPLGSTLVAVCDAEVVFTGWSGSGGYAIILVKDNLRFSYCHTSPNFFVTAGDTVYKGQPIRYGWSKKYIRYS